MVVRCVGVYGVSYGVRFLQFGEAIAMSHLLLQPGRSAGIKQIGLDLLLKIA